MTADHDRFEPRLNLYIMRTVLPGLFFTCLLVFVFSAVTAAHDANKPPQIKFYKASDQKIRYTGRVDFTNTDLPRFWAPGVYINAVFTGPSVLLDINDEAADGKNHNYISVQIDDLPVKRIKLKSNHNFIEAASGLSKGPHHLMICKSTESGIGYLEFAGLHCEKLINLPAAPARKIEYIGDSITCGTGSDSSEFTCGSGEWYDQHNAMMSYGPLTSRALNAQWQLTAVSGIGLTKSCCEMKVIMPDVVDKVNMRDNLILWDFEKYQPDVVTVCLGQNDGIQDSTVFCTAYFKFLQRLRAYYPLASIICLTSPMANDELAAVQQKQLLAINNAAWGIGDRNIYHYAFSKRFHHGCGDHPDLAEHQQISAELSAFIKKTKNW